MNLLLTGASGFLGRNFLLGAPASMRILALYRGDTGFPDFVSSLGRPNITALHCDLNDESNVRQMFDLYGEEWNSCLYLAAKVDIPWSVREPKSDLLANTVPLLNLLDGLRADKFVYFSSGAVYDGLAGAVESDAPLNPTLPYAISKMTCERYVEFHHRRKGSIKEYLNVRFFGAYGPYEATHKIYSRLVRAFAFEHCETYEIYGDGRNIIDAMYVDDAINAILLMLAGPHWNRAINLAAGHPTTIETLVRESAAALGVENVRVQFKGVAHESNLFSGSTRDMAALYGFDPRVTLTDGMRRFRDFALSRWPPPVSEVVK